VINGSPVFRDTAEELIAEFPDSCQVENPNTGEVIPVPPKSFAFINGTIFDNPALIRNNPKYLSELKSLPEIEKQRLLYGNWYARPQNSTYFNRDWLMKIPELPAGVKTVRAWDKAAQEVSDVNRNPDYTCSIKMSKCKQGFYYISADYHPETKDEKSEILGQFRKRPGERDTLVQKQAEWDGHEVAIVFATDPGAAGKVEFTESAKKLITEGFIVKSDPMPNNKSKLARFSPFSSACENKLVYIVEDSFPNKATLDNFYANLEAFDGQGSTRIKKDDLPDCTASAFNYLCKERVMQTLDLSSFISNTKTTRLNDVMSQSIPVFN